MTFEAQLAIGQMGESIIARWLRSRGWNVLPAYDKELGSGKGPQLFMADGGDKGELIAPDLLALKDGRFMWIEAKHKSVFTWYGKGHCWQTGIDRRHYRDYLLVMRRLGIPVWLMFLHRASEPWVKDRERWPDCPAVCPTGLFGRDLARLEMCGREDERHGSSGMVYWNHADLRLIAPLESLPLDRPAIHAQRIPAWT